MRFLTLTALLLFALPATVTPQGGLSSAEKKQAKQVITEYFAETDDDKREALLGKLTPIDHPSKADLKYFEKFAFKLARKGPRHKRKNKAKCTHPDYPGEYYVRVPSTAKRRKTGVFFGLHGGGEGSGDGQQIQGIFGVPDSKLICVYPTVIKKGTGAWNNEREERYVLAILEELKRTYRIDTNRIYLAGHSMGGFGTWSIGGRHADVFAAVSPMAGGTYGRGVVANFHNLPLWCYHSTDDPRVKAASDIRAMKEIADLQEEYGGYEHVWKLYSDIGHGFPKDGVRPIFQWMLKNKRNPYPEHIVWEPSRNYKRHFYWLRSDQSRGRIEVKRKDNTFEVVGEPRGLWIYLNRHNCDLKKPVVVKVGGKTVHDGLAKFSLVSLIESIGVRNDPELVFIARIKAS